MANGGTATAQVEVIVQPVNDAPHGYGRSLARTLEDTEVEIDVLANDTDIDGDALRVESVSVPAARLCADCSTDRNGSTGRYRNLRTRCELAWYG